MSSEATSATAIHADRAAGTVEIDWADGHVSTYTMESLRWLCPCAYCRGEGGLPGWLDSGPTLSEDQVRLVDLKLVGRYAVAPVWGDGHATGFYAFELLRDRCPCPECRRRRDSRPEAEGVTPHAVHAPPVDP